MSDRSETRPPADEGRLDRRVRPLREGEVMGVYLDFDRRADRAQPPVDYLLGFGAAVSAATVAANAEAEAEIERLHDLLRQIGDLAHDASTGRAQRRLDVPNVRAKATAAGGSPLSE